MSLKVKIAICDFIFLIFVGISLNVNSQDFDKVFYNSRWEITSLKSGKFYRKSGFNRDLIAFEGVVVDYYMNGNIEMTGNYIDGTKDGEFIYFYPNQTIKAKTKYLRNKRVGIWTEYYPNGKVYKEMDYSGATEKLLQYNDKNGKDILKGLSGQFKQVLYYNYGLEIFSTEKYDSLDSSYILKGKFLNGVKVGTWVLNNQNDEVVCKLKFENGVFDRGDYFSDFGKQIVEKEDIAHIILEPNKIAITETFLAEPGQVIKQNFLVKALNEQYQLAEKKKILTNEEELTDYFNLKYSLFVKNCADTFAINVTLKVDDQGKVTIAKILPKIPKSFEKEVSRVIDTVDKIEGVKNKDISINHQVMCKDLLNGKK